MDALARPFTVAAVKFKPQTVTKDKSKASASFYIDSRLVVERLNDAVGAENWCDEYRLLVDGAQAPALFYPIECRLTVNGVTRADVGQGASQIVDDKAWKSAYSDAFKRAAVKFRVGAYLYVLPRLWAAVDVNAAGKVLGFSKEGQRYLRDSYSSWLVSDLNRFGEALDHGDLDDEDSGGEPSAASTSAPNAQPSRKPTRPASSPVPSPAPGGAAISPASTVPENTPAAALTAKEGVEPVQAPSSPPGSWFMPPAKAQAKIKQRETEKEGAKAPATDAQVAELKRIVKSLLTRDLTVAQVEEMLAAYGVGKFVELQVGEAQELLGKLERLSRNAGKAA